MNSCKTSDNIVQGGGRPASVSWSTAAGSREIAAAPANAPARVPDARSASVGGFWRDLFGVAVDRRTWGALLYMLIALGTGTAYFTLVVTGLSLSAGMIILVVGLPLLLAVLGAVRGLSLAESRLVEALLGTRIATGRQTHLHGEGVVARVRFWLKDRRTWTGMAYLLLHLPLGIAYFTVAVAGFAAGAWLIVLPFLQWIGGHTYIHYGSGSQEFLFLPWQLPLLFIAGCVVILAWMHIVRGLGRAHAAYAQAMLGDARPRQR